MTTESSKNRAMTLSRMNFSKYVGHATIFSQMLITIIVAGLGLGLG